MTDIINYKLVVVGSERVGKTTFINKHLKGEFIEDYKPTIGVSVSNIKFNTTIGDVVFSIWDIAGNPKLSGFSDGYLIGADCAIVMFDVTNLASYKSVPNHFKSIKRVLESVPIILCGNKMEEEEDDKIKLKQNEFSGDYQYYYDISTKSNYNYEKPFLKLIQLLKNDESISFTQSQQLLPVSGMDLSAVQDEDSLKVSKETAVNGFSFGALQSNSNNNISSSSTPKKKAASSVFKFDQLPNTTESSLSNATGSGFSFGHSQSNNNNSFSFSNNTTTPMFNNNNSYKLVILGSSGVGKTTWVNRLLTGEFTKDHIPTIGVSVSNLSYKTTTGEVNFSAWDIAGCEKFAGIIDGYLMGTDCAIIMFDVTSRISYKDVPKWFLDTSRVSPDIPIILCGNKVDEKERKVKPRNILFHRKKNLPYFDISAKSNYNYEKPILKLIQLLKRDDSISFSPSQQLLPVTGMDLSATQGLYCDGEHEIYDDLDSSSSITSGGFLFGQSSTAESEPTSSTNETTPGSGFSFGQLSATAAGSGFSFSQIPKTIESSPFSSLSNATSSGFSFGPLQSNNNNNSFSFSNNTTIPTPIFENKDSNKSYKLVILGSSGVGKTTWVNRLLTGEFTKKHIATIGVSVSNLNYKTTIGEVNFSVWDQAGCEKLAIFSYGYMIGADCAIIMFDVTSPTSYKDVSNWFSDISRVSPDIPIILCGNKADENDRRVNESSITFHIENNLPYFDISAKSNYNHEKPILKLIQLLKNNEDILFVESKPLLPVEIDINSIQNIKSTSNNSLNNNNNNNNNNSSVPLLDNHFDPDTLNDSFKNNFNI